MINARELSQAIASTLAEYNNEVTEALENKKEEIAQKTADKLKETSPEGATKRYKKGWKVSDINGKKIVHNKTDYQLTHLLEYGHAKRNGGRVSARPHIRQAEEEAIRDFTEGVEEVIRR